MKLDLCSIEIQGFKTFKHAVIKTNELGLILVCGKNLTEPKLGSNGSGKTSIFDAIFWCLWGKTVDGLRTPDIRPWKKSDLIRVATKIRVDGKKHTIERSDKTNGLTINKKVVSQEQVNQLLGISFELASHTILMGQGRPLFFDQQPREKMDLFSDALSLERWEARSRAARDSTTILEQDLTKVSGEINSLIDLETELVSMMKDLKKRIKDWSDQEQVDLDAVENQIAQKSKRLEALKNDHAKYDLTYDGCQTELRALAAQISSMHRAKSDTWIAEERRKKIEEEIAAFDKTKDCPTCGQPITKMTKDQRRKELLAKLKKLPVPKISLKDLEAKIKRLMISENKFQIRANQAKDSADTLQKEISQLEVEVSVLKKSLAKKQEEINPFQEQLTELRKKKINIGKNIDEKEKQEATLKRKIQRTSFWIKGFKEVRLLIVEEILQELEIVTSSMLQEVGLVNWEVFYEIEKATKSGKVQNGLNVWIKSPSNKNPVKWESWSGGEGQRLKIVGALALSDVLLNHVGVRTNFEILDEPTSFFAKEGVQDLTEFLGQRALDQEKIILYTDHHASEGAQFASTITVVKEKGVSRVAQV